MGSRRTWAPSRGRGERQRQEAHPPSADQRPSLQARLPDYSTTINMYRHYGRYLTHRLIPILLFSSCSSFFFLFFFLSNPPPSLMLLFFSFFLFVHAGLYLGICAPSFQFVQVIASHFLGLIERGRRGTGASLCCPDPTQFVKSINPSVSRSPEPVVAVTVMVTVTVIRFDKASRAPYSRFLLFRLGTKWAWPGQEQASLHEGSDRLHRLRSQTTLKWMSSACSYRGQQLTVSRAPSASTARRLIPGPFSIQHGT